MKKLSLLLILVCSTCVHAQQLQLKLPEPPVWDLDTNTSPLREREAALAPEEEPIAVQIRPLLQDKQYAEAIAVLDAQDSSQFSAAMHFVEAQTHLALADFEEAGISYQATIDKMPDFLRAHRGLGVVLLHQGELAQAAVHVTKAIELGANDAQIYGQLSYINLEQGRPWSAISGYQQAMFLEPENLQWQQGLLYALTAAGNYSDAKALLREMLEQNPMNGVLWLQLGNLALNTDNKKEAISNLEMAIRLGESSPENNLVTGQLHLQSGSTARGIDLLSSVVTIEPELTDEVLKSLGWLEQREQWTQLHEFIVLLQEDLTLLTATQKSRLLLAQSSLSRRNNRYDQARSELDQALDLDPTNGTALLALSELLTEQDPIRAGLLLTRAQGLDTFRERALIAQAQLAIDQQLYQEALELLVQVVDENPQRTDFNESIASLQRIIVSSETSEN